MQLLYVEYKEFSGRPEEWALERLTLNKKNLIVGRNSTGKTRTLNIISATAKILSGQQAVGGSGETTFAWKCSAGKEYIYSTKVEDRTVLKETLTVDGKELITRNENGIGQIYAEKIGDFLEFQMPQTELAIVKRRDLIQHSYIEPIYKWSISVRHYHFGSHFGKDLISIINPSANAVDDRDENAVVGILRAGIKEFGEIFTSSIIQDMAKVGYNIDSITTGAPIALNFQGAPGEVTSVNVKQKEFAGIVDQWNMSQGMYRLLSLSTHINYMRLKKTGVCVLIDDIGEGLDFERSCQTISLLREKAEESNIQIIMSTNDRFVMNEVPLKEWTVLSRAGSHVTVRNYDNSAAQFDEFKYTGLSNFSFFELDYLNSAEEEKE